MWKSIGEIKLSARAKDDNDKVNTKTTKLNEELKPNDVLKPEPEKKKSKPSIFGGNDNKHTLVIFNTKDSKDNVINNNAIEFEEYEKGNGARCLKTLGIPMVVNSQMRFRQMCPRK